jgi:23S rRNA pseudouridine2604 synthase
MGNGVRLQETVTKKCFVKQEGKNRFRIILTQGLNRQIRRMCKALGYNVETLKRVRIMNITLADLPLGKWRYFTPAEMRTMEELVANSSKTAEASGGNNFDSQE